MKTYIAAFMTVALALCAQPKGPQPGGKPPRPGDDMPPAKVKQAPPKNNSNISKGQVQPAKVQPAKVQPAKPGPTKNDPPKADPKKSSGNKTVFYQPEPPKPAPRKPEPPKPAAHKPEPPKPDFRKPEPPHHPEPPKPPHHPEPPKGYKPGHHDHPLPPPRERAFYTTWAYVPNGYFYSYDTIPETLQCNLRPHQTLKFSMEENATTGFMWFARYNPSALVVSMDHEGPSRSLFGFVGRPGYATLNVSAKYPCDTMVEIIYARSWEWEKGVPPAKVIQLFIHAD